MTDRSVLQALLLAGCLIPSQGSDDGESFVAPAGASSVCRYCLEQSGATTQFGQTIKSVTRSQRGDQWVVQPFKATAMLADAVVFTGTVAEVCSTHGEISRGWKRRKGARVEYSKQFTVTLVLATALYDYLDWRVWLTGG